VGTQNFFLLVRKSQIRKFSGSFRNHKSANFWGLLVRKSPIRKFVLINPQITNPKIPLWSQFANSKYANLLEKNSVSDPDPHWFASNTFCGLQKYILDYEMSHKSFLNFETFEAYICEKKNYLIADLRKF
jgi:hypothetical protein